jgi:hypothetical protein
MGNGCNKLPIFEIGYAEETHVDEETHFLQIIRTQWKETWETLPAGHCEMSHFAGRRETSEETWEDGGYVLKQSDPRPKNNDARTTLRFLF